MEVSTFAILIGTIIGICLKINEDKKEIENRKEQQRRADEENRKLAMKSRLERDAKGLFFDNPLKPYNSIIVELNYKALTRSEKSNGYISPLSPNYSKENKEKYEKQLNYLKDKENYEADEWLRKLKK